jgi:hypothetical protein
MTPEIEPLNWLAVILGAVATFLLGWLVYSPRLFGKGWAEGSGVKLGDAAQMPITAMITQLVALALLSAVIGLTAMTSALWTAVLAILAAATFVVSNGLFLKKTAYALRVDGLYIVGSGIIMILFQGLI